MSNYQRRHATPEEFNDLVKEYYRVKEQEYDSAWDLIAVKDERKDKREVSQEPEEEGNKEEKKGIELLIREKMPHHEAEETATGSITDQVAKESKDSTASDHPMHDVDTGATSGGSQGAKATAQDHKATPGPVETSDLGEKTSKEENKLRAQELNK